MRSSIVSLRTTQSIASGGTPSDLRSTANSRSSVRRPALSQASTSLGVNSCLAQRVARSWLKCGPHRSILLMIAAIEPGLGAGGCGNLRRLARRGPGTRSCSWHLWTAVGLNLSQYRRLSSSWDCESSKYHLKSNRSSEASILTLRNRAITTRLARGAPAPDWPTGIALGIGRLGKRVHRRPDSASPV